MPSEVDKFVAMMTAKAEVDLRLSDYAPRSMLVSEVHILERPRYPAIDFHNHLDGLEPEDVLRVMDACGVEHVVNITMQTGDEALRRMARLHASAPGRFSTIAWMDWDGLDQGDFFSKAVHRLEESVAHGACGLKIWKDLGLRLKDHDGSMLRIDDERLSPLFEKAAELGVFVMFHTADPAAFFLPTDRTNERYEELAAHPDWSFYGSTFSKAELLEQRNRVFARHPRTTFVCAHMGEQPEDLKSAAALLETYPHVHFDISARIAELGRQPFTARKFFLQFSERLIFGTDLLPEIDMYRAHYRFLETADEYFEYPSHASRQGRWCIYGIDLPDQVLARIYRENARALLGRAG